MTIKKFVGKTQEEATQKAKQEFGENCVIMNVKSLRPSGIFRIFRSTVYEVTAAVEEKDNLSAMNKNFDKSDLVKQSERINFVADEKGISFQPLLSDSE